MQEEGLAATLVLPEAQLYIVVAIFVAITAMTAADVRDKARLLPRKGVNVMTIALALGSWISGAHIIFATLGNNDIHALSAGAVVGMYLHCLMLILLIVVVNIWYWVVALYKETPAGMPTNPAASSRVLRRSFPGVATTSTATIPTKQTGTTSPAFIFSRV